MRRKASFFRWINPQDLSRLTQLQMISRGVVEGLSGGIHRSPLVGASVDFKEHRPYVPGDEVRSIDWKLFGKSDRLYIRQFEDETNMRCVLIVDQSGSMKYQNANSTAVSKHDYAVRLAACFAYLFISQQDAAGVATFDTIIRSYIPPKSQPSHLQLITELLANSTPGGETDISSVLQAMTPRLQKRGLAMLFSDCLSDPQQLVRSLALMKSHVRNVIVCQILDEDEWDFPFQQRTMFRSLERADHSVVTDPTFLRKSYLEKLQKHQAFLTSGFRQYGIEFKSVRTSENLGDVVSRFLSERTAKLSMGGA